MTATSSKLASARMRILLVSQMYPGPEEPDYGVFVRQLELELADRGHEIARAVLTRRGVGSRAKYLELARRTVRAARGFRPEVVYAHFLVPTGLIALLPRAPLVVTAHGQDVSNVGVIPGIAAATRAVVARAHHVIAVSDYLRRELERKVPAAAGKTSVVNCGVDLERFGGADADEARARLGWNGDSPAFLCVGYLSERKNVVRLAEAFEAFGDGRLAFVGDGPLRPLLEGRRRVRVVGRVPHDEVASWVAASDVVCQPSLVEPFGQALLEAMASERSVVATRVGGPPEFVTPEAGTLVEPTSVDEIADGLRRASALPRPNVAARAAAARYDVRLQAARVEEILVRAVRGRPA